jgi:mycothiol synthase
MSFELRPPSADDVTALAGLSAREYGGMTPVRIRDLMASAHTNVEENWRVAVDDGRVVGAAYIWHPETGEGRVFITTQAYPRTRDLYEELLDWSEERARSLLRDGSGRLHSSAGGENDLLAGILRDRGFERVRHFFTMEIDLAEEPAEPVWPEGIEVRALRPGEERAVYDVDMEAFQDHWDFFPVPFEEWREFFLGSAQFDPELWSLALDGDEIAGAAICSWEIRPGIGRVNVLAVRRPWRRRGLGRALLLHSFHQFRRRGRKTVDLNVDAENLTGAVGLYESAGMHVAHRDDSYRKDI